MAVTASIIKTVSGCWPLGGMLRHKDIGIAPEGLQREKRSMSDHHDLAVRKLIISRMQ
jgi:hypothetical protein